MLQTLALIACLLSRDATADSTVKAFVQAFNSQDWKAMFSRVEGAKIDEVVPGFTKLMSPPASNPKITIKSVALIEAGDESSGPIHFVTQTGTSAPVNREDEVHLHKTNGDWKIVDGKESKGVFSQLCVIARFPSKMPAVGANQKSYILSNLKMIGLGIEMYLTDWDDKFSLDQSSMKSKLKPYLAKYNENDHLWKSMDGTPLDIRINPALIGKVNTKIADPSVYVMLSLGPKDKLQYLFGETPIVFVDGHAKYLKQEAVSTLKWK